MNDGDWKEIQTNFFEMKKFGYVFKIYKFGSTETFFRLYAHIGEFCFGFWNSDDIDSLKERVEKFIEKTEKFHAEEL